MTNEERQQAIEWLKNRPITMPGAKKMFALAVEALEAYVPDMNGGDMISRQAAIYIASGYCHPANIAKELAKLPSAGPERMKGQEIIRCKDCAHWKLQIGNVKGDGLGSCDFHNVNLVTGEGFCYWADKRGDSE